MIVVVRGAGCRIGLMSSATVRAPTSIGIRKLLTGAKVNAVIGSAANAVIQGTGSTVGDVRGLPFSGAGGLARQQQPLRRQALYL